MLTILQTDHTPECATKPYPPCDCGGAPSKFYNASHEMFQSKWAGQVGMRAIRLVNQMDTGEWVD